MALRSEVISHSLCRSGISEELSSPVISHIPSDFNTERCDFQLYFSWNGTPDPTPALRVPCSNDFMAALHLEGWQGVMSSNRKLAEK
jgi:hypothetical protein